MVVAAAQRAPTGPSERGASTLLAWRHGDVSSVGRRLQCLQGATPCYIVEPACFALSPIHFHTAVRKFPGAVRQSVPSVRGSPV